MDYRESGITMDRVQFTTDLVTLRDVYQSMTNHEEDADFYLTPSEIKVLLNMLNSFDSQTGALSTPIDDYVKSIYGKV